MKVDWVRKMLIIALGLLAGVPDPALAAEGEVAVKCGLSQNRITVGDPVELLIQLTHPAGYRIEPPADSIDFGKLELLDQQVAELPADNEGNAGGILFHFRITAFEPGEFMTPRIQIPYLADGGEEPREATCDPLRIEVKAVLAEEAQDLEDIKEPLELPAEGISWWLWGGLLMALAGLGWWFWKRRSRKAEVASLPEVPALPPYREALEALARLERERLPEQGETKRHYVELSAIIRRYIHRRYGIDALEMTSGQLARELRSKAPDAMEDGLLVGLLRESDLVKFARLEPSFERNQLLLETARRWLDSTRPLAAAVEDKEQQAS